HHPARGLRPLVVGDDLHAGRRLADAGRRQHALALDLDHAGAAVAVRAVVGIGLPAQMGDLVPEAIGDLPDGLTRLGRDLAAVKDERDPIAHRRSSRKCFMTILTGLQAAWPRPQIEASVMTRASSSSRATSQVGCDISLTAFSVPTRQ